MDNRVEHNVYAAFLNSVYKAIRDGVPNALLFLSHSSLVFFGLSVLNKHEYIDTKSACITGLGRRGHAAMRLGYHGWVTGITTLDASPSCPIPEPNHSLRAGSVSVLPGFVTMSPLTSPTGRVASIPAVTWAVLSLLLILAILSTVLLITSHKRISRVEKPLVAFPFSSAVLDGTDMPSLPPSLSSRSSISSRNRRIRRNSNPPDVAGFDPILDGVVTSRSASSVREQPSLSAVHTLESVVRLTAMDQSTEDGISLAKIMFGPSHSQESMGSREEDLTFCENPDIIGLLTNNIKPRGCASPTGDAPSPTKVTVIDMVTLASTGKFETMDVSSEKPPVKDNENFSIFDSADDSSDFSVDTDKLILDSEKETDNNDTSLGEEDQDLSLDSVINAARGGFKTKNSGINSFIITPPLVVITKPEEDVGHGLNTNSPAYAEPSVRPQLRRRAGAKETKASSDNYPQFPGALVLPESYLELKEKEEEEDERVHLDDQIGSRSTHTPRLPSLPLDNQQGDVQGSASPITTTATAPATNTTGNIPLSPTRAQSPFVIAASISPVGAGATTATTTRVTNSQQHQQQQRRWRPAQVLLDALDFAGLYLLFGPERPDDDSDCEPAQFPEEGLPSSGSES